MSCSPRRQNLRESRSCSIYGVDNNHASIIVTGNGHFMYHYMYQIHLPEMRTTFLIKRNIIIHSLLVCLVSPIRFWSTSSENPWASPGWSSPVPSKI